METYTVEFTATIEVEADNTEEAVEKAQALFSDLATCTSEKAQALFSPRGLYIYVDGKCWS